MPSTDYGYGFEKPTERSFPRLPPSSLRLDTDALTAGLTLLDCIHLGGPSANEKLAGVRPQYANEESVHQVKKSLLRQWRHLRLPFVPNYSILVLQDDGI